MPTESAISPTEEDIRWASQFRSLHLLLKQCPSSEKATLLLSTCRNAYMTVNALFTELQSLMGDAVDPSAIRGGAEYLIAKDLDVSKLRERFARAIQTVREFELKRQVWADRSDLWQEIERTKEAIATVDPLAAPTVELLLRNTRIPDQSFGDGFEHEVLAIDLADRPHLGPYFEILDRQKTILGHAAHLGWSVAAALAAQSRQPQLEFGDTTHSRADEASSASRIPDIIRSLAEACDWLVVRTPQGTAVQLSDNYVRPQNAANRTQIVLPALSSVDPIDASAADIGFLIREVLYFVHTNLAEAFRPNVAQQPMPSLFSIALPMSVHTQHNGGSTPTIVKRIRCSERGEPKDTIRIGLAGLAVPFGKMNGKNYALGADLAKKVSIDVRRAVEAAREAKCDAVVFPEYSVPRAMLTELHNLANLHGMVIVGGLEGEWLHGKLYDQAAVFIPGEKRTYFQSKQEPSLEEEAGDGFYRDGEIKLFSNSPIGNFSVVVCSDFLQLATLRSWRDDAELPEVMFVIARNKYRDLYINFAKADSVRLYTSVVISNVCDDSDEVASANGSCVVMPAQLQMELSGDIFSVGGQFIESLTAYDISLRAIRAKSRGKPDKGYIAVPKSAQRV